MATKVKLTVTIGSDLVKELDEEAKSRKLSRSALLEEAVRLLKQKRLESVLKSGYQAMAEENLRMAEELLHVGREAMNEKQ